jgi:hypothetical protein
MHQQKRSKHIAGVTSVYTDRAFEDMTRTELDKLLRDQYQNVRKKVMSGLRGYTAKTVGTAGYHHDNYGKMVAYSDAYCYFYGATVGTAGYHHDHYGKVVAYAAAFTVQ